MEILLIFPFFKPKFILSCLIIAIMYFYNNICTFHIRMNENRQFKKENRINVERTFYRILTCRTQPKKII